MDDAALVRRLAIEKLEAKAAELRPQWAWTKAVLDPEYGFMAQYARVRSQPGELPPELAAGIERIERRLGELEEVARTSGLRPLRQCQPRRQYRIGPPTARRTRPAAVKRGQRRHRKSPRRQRVERLSLLRRAYDHHRDLRTRLPAAAVAYPIDRARQLMTITPLSPSPITSCPEPTNHIKQRRQIPHRSTPASVRTPPAVSSSRLFGRLPSVHPLTPATGRRPKTLNTSGLLCGDGRATSPKCGCARILTPGFPASNGPAVVGPADGGLKLGRLSAGGRRIRTLVP